MVKIPKKVSILLNLTKRNPRIVNGKGGVDLDITIPEGITCLLKEWKDRWPKEPDHFICNIKNRKAEYQINTKDGRMSNPTSKKVNGYIIKAV